jgi:nucleoid DNA-binding protein
LQEVLEQEMTGALGLRKGKGVRGDGENLLISGFKTSLVRQKNARRERNPQTKEALRLKAGKALVFKTSGG